MVPNSIVGVLLALTSGVLIGMSLVLQKKGLLQTTRPCIWWAGVALLGLGEVFNFVAYAFAPAILVTPLGSVSVIVSAILSKIFLNEHLNFSGWMGILLCMLGSIIVVLHGPPSTVTSTIPEFFNYVVAPGFISFMVVGAVTLTYLAFVVAPKVFI
jgi:drug/metabolite transporter (DMT)-like permease